MVVLIVDAVRHGHVDKRVVGEITDDCEPI
jgi:hypothetical protein